ncbi:hypothetical protein SAMN04488535_0995 [Corynebacterium mycetoides]|uniref:Uncharacterized protein n=1 Tax=Corynebacterium mycetoides TaxID=38302 RepID=A0A1G9NF13_9CORY|nr:hypothetical protein [Corynebacterium mycetoides]SDL85136.1 hypothetical protein SAMN04488535_0995 [Corynebacterium mycetoides]
MHTRATRRASLTAALILFSAALPAAAQAEDPAAEGPAGETCATSTGAGADIQPAPDNSAAAAAAAMEQIQAGAITLHNNALDVDQASAYSITTEGERFDAVTIPVAGEFSRTSNVTVVFNGAGEVVRYSETLVDKADNGKFRVRVFNDGAQVKDETTDLDYMNDDELTAASQVDPNQPTVTTYGVGSTVACLAAVAGIGGPIAYLIASACAGSCAGVATGVGAAICAACIGGYATLGAGGMTAAASCFK